ncbi:hypothetical protein MMC25_008084 [Agyrium rufum]|nr:hypothetical protein [Agyrium rufum]
MNLTLSAPSFHVPIEILATEIARSTSPGSLSDHGFDTLRNFLEDGSFTSVDLVKAYLERIFEVNYRVNAVSEINPDALDIARALDSERSAGLSRGPLHGIPILVKDNIATCDKLNNTSGSLALLGATVSRDAYVVQRLRAAGAIILGKATMGEWAQFRSRQASGSHGWSAYGGQAVGAYYPDQDPSGSSSGSAVAVSIGLAAGSLATETSGSILLPAEKANLVGIKPSVGLTSRDLTIPISLRQDTIGPMAKSVKDAAYLLSAIAGKDKADNWTLAQPFENPPDYVRACSFSGFRGIRVGVPRNGIEYFGARPAIIEAFEDALRVLREAGAEVVDHADFPHLDKPAMDRNASIVLGTDFAQGLATYFSQLVKNPHGINTLADVVHYTTAENHEQYPDRDIHVWERELVRNLTVESPQSRAAFAANLKMGEEWGVQGALDRWRLDVLAMPTSVAFHLPALAGLPVVTVPLGFFPPHTPLVMNPKGTLVDIAPGVPFGISFLGRRWSEDKLIQVAYVYEQRTQNRQNMQPHIRPSFELANLLPTTGKTIPHIVLEQKVEDATRQSSQLGQMVASVFRAYRKQALALHTLISAAS